MVSVASDLLVGLLEIYGRPYVSLSGAGRMKIFLLLVAGGRRSNVVRELVGRDMIEVTAS